VDRKTMLSTKMSTLEPEVSLYVAKELEDVTD
jgi:hypothetical protein